jgi:hypothetical protein
MAWEELARVVSAISFESLRTLRVIREEAFRKWRAATAA